MISCPATLASITWVSFWVYRSWLENGRVQAHETHSLPRRRRWRASASESSAKTLSRVCSMMAWGLTAASQSESRPNQLKPESGSKRTNGRVIFVAAHSVEARSHGRRSRMPPHRLPWSGGLQKGGLITNQVVQPSELNLHGHLRERGFSFRVRFARPYLDP